MTLVRIAGIFSLLLLCAGAVECAWAQSPVVSPRDSVRITFNGRRISVAYGKPAVRGRWIFGGAVPYYKVWRTGAGEATILHTDADLEMDGAVVPRGSYSLYTIPAEGRWKFILNKQTGQWGTVYDARLDLARMEVSPKTLRAPAESLAFRLEKTGTDAGVIRLEWDRTAIAVPFKVSRDSLLPSPRDSATFTSSAARIVIDYGRPSMRGRKIFGGVVPYGQVWRAGANAATSFSTTADLLLGTVTVPRGSYTLYVLPDRDGSKLIVNTQTGQWGTVYTPGKDLARIPMKRRSLRTPMEKFTIEIVPQGVAGGEVRLQWERTLFAVPFRIK